MDLLRLRAEARPDLRVYTFLAEGEKEAGNLTSAGLDRRARSLAAALQETAAPGERALLLFPPGLDFIAAFFGCLYAGVVAVPAYPPRANRVDARLWEIFRDARPRFVLTTSAILARLRAVQDRSPELRAASWIATDLLPEDLARDWREPELEPGSLAFLQYTSGSTSAPKGVKVSHGNLIHNERMIQRAFRQSEESVVVSWLPLYHDMGLIGGVLQPLFSGSRCILMSPWAFLQSPVRWLEAISRYRGTTSGGPDFAYELCVRKVRPERRADLDLSSWEVAFNGAEPVRAATLQRFAEAFAPCGFRREAFHPCYGLAEATLLVTGGGDPAPVTLEVDAEALAADRVKTGGPAVRSLAGSGRVPGGLGEQVRIVDPATGLPCDAEQVGEIWVAGPHVAGGYWNRPEESAAVFGAFLPDGEGPFLRTGDLGFFHGGELFVTGRLKDLIILRGRNLYPQDVELTVERSHPDLRPGSGAAFSVEVEGEERLVVVQELEPRSRADVEKVAAAVRRAVAEEHEARVHEVVLIAAGTLPKTTSGKVQRRACRAAWLAGSLEVVGRSAVPGPAPDEDGAGGSLEELLGREVARLAGGVAPDPETPLAALGLDSLAAVELASRIEAETGVSLSPADLLRCAGLRALAAEVQARSEGGIDGREAALLPEGPETGDHPLSAGQKALWLEDRLAPEAAAYNIVAAARIEGDLDLGALRRAFSALAERHPALRTTFEERDGEPVQRVHARLEPDFQASDGDLDPEAWRPFDLETGPLLRVRVLPDGEGGSLLLLVVHHLVADFWSLSVLARELAELYRQETGGAPAGLEPLPVRYTDWVRWQERRLAGPRGERLWAYWRERLGGGPPVLDLPTDRPRPPARSGRGGSRARRISPGIVDAARAAAGAGSTLYVTLLAAFEAVLHRYTGQEDLLVGTPTAGRGGADLAGLVGYFVNPVALRADLSGRPGFAELAARGRTTALEALEHGDFPLPLLAARLRAGSPLFQVMFVLQSAGPDTPGLAAFGLGEEGTRVRLGKLALESVASRERRALFDLTLFAAETEEGGAQLSLQFDADLFDAATAGRLLEHLETLLAAGAADPGRPVAALPILTASERGQLLEWNDTGEIRPDAPLLHEAFAAQAERTPGAAALIWGEETFTYADLRRRARGIALRLARLGVGPEVRIGVLMRRRPELVASLLGVLEAGGAYVPLDPSYPEERLAFTLEDAGALAILTFGEREHELARRLAGPEMPIVRLEEEDEGDLEHPVSSRALPGNLAYLIYTSGSTGRPKAVAIEHRSAAAFLEWAGSFFAAEDLAAVSAPTSITFDISVFEIFVPLSRGGAVVLADDALALPGLPAAGSLTLVNTVPSAMAELLRLGGLPASVRVVNLAGEPLAPELVEAVYRLCPSVRAVHNFYGPSEDTTYSTVARVGRGTRSVPVGRPISGSRVYIVDREMELMPPGLPGELLIGGAGLARGYLGRPGLTAERFIPDPFGAAPGERLYRTGDLIRYRPDGQLEFLGRLDHQVKIRGFRIELGEVEAALRRHEGIREAVVVARPDAGGVLSLAAFYVPEEDRPAPADLRSFLARSLPEHMVPSVLVALEALPLTPNGKVDRKALRERPVAVEGEAPVSALPRSPVEEILAGIWADALGVERIGPRDHFFDLGGHSLLASRVAARVREALGVELPLRAVFERPVLADLAREVEEKLEERRLPSALPPLTPAPRDPEGAPLSFAQQRLWFLDRLAPGGAVYNMPAAVRLEGRLDRAALAAALDEVARRHEALRTTFSEVAGEVRQRVAPRLDLTPPMIDLSGLPAPARDEEAARLAAEEARRPFDLQAGPLARVALLALAPEEHTALLTLHHIVSDGASMGIFLRELAAPYRGEALAALPVQYADFAVWQRSWLRGEALESRLASWRQRLAGAPPVLDLPTDRPRPAEQRFRGAREALELRPDLVRGLQALGREEGATLFMTLAAGFAALLSRYSGQDDLLVGTAAANRDRVEIEGLIGFFVNTLALRFAPGGSRTGRELLRAARDEALAAYAGQDLPFEVLVRDLHPERDPSRNPLVQVFFAMQEVPLEPVELPGLTLRPEEVAAGAAKFDLAASVATAGSGLAVSVEYDRDLFDASTIRRFLGHFRVLLAGLAAGPGARLPDLPLLTREETAQIALWSRGPEALPEARCVHGLFEAWADRTPEAVAVVAGGESLTYGELEARANRLARRLRGLGVGPEVRAALSLPRSPEGIVALLAILKAGGVYLPLDPTYPRERRAWMLADSGARVVVTRESLREDLPLPEGVEAVCVDAGPGDGDASRPAGWALPESLAYVIYTSGSTGQPKGVGVEHRMAARHLREVAPAFGIARGVRVLQTAAWSFDMSIEQILATLGAGASMALWEGELDPADLRRQVEALEVSFLSLTPSFLQVWTRRNAGAREPDLPVRGVLCGGEAMPPELARLWPETPLRNARLLNGYGPTEAVVAATLQVVPPGASLPAVPIGRPLPGRTAHVLDGNGGPVPAGVPGELLLGGLLARGYLGRPGATAEKFIPDPFSGVPGARLYRTGDKVRWLPSGELEFLGRIDQQVKVRGFRIEPGEIEAALAAHPAVAQAAVVAAGEEESRLVAFLAPRAEEALPEAGELRTFLGRTLPAHMVPSAFVTVPSLPLTPSGKVDRRALARGAPAAAEARASYVAPSTPVEEILAGIWAAVLGIERVGARDDFFELGGHSLLATQVQSRVREALGVEIPLRKLFEAPTVAALAAVIEGERKSQTPPVVPVPRDGDLPLSFAQRRLWFLHQLAPESPNYNMAGAFLCAGRLDERALAACFREIERLHETLRTRFPAAAGRPRQEILPEPEVEIPVVDLSGLPAAGRERESRRLTLAEARRPFDLERGPVMRLTLLRLEPERRVLLATLHHIAADGWSMGVLFRDFTAVYEALAAGRPSPLRPPPVQYADFAVWQRRRLQGEVRERELAYWRVRLAEVPTLELPADRPRPAEQSFRGAAISIELPGPAIRALRTLARRWGATLFMVYLAAFKALLHRYTGQEEIIIGSPIANRERTEIEGLIGFFVNTLVLRTGLAGDQAFPELVARVREVALGAYAHQALPFETLVEELQPERDLSRQPLFQMMFQLLENPIQAVELPGVRVEPLEADPGTAHFDLGLDLLETPAGTRAVARYSTDLFDGTTIRRLLEHYAILLTGLAEAPERKVSGLLLLSPAEVHQLQWEWNDTAFDAGGIPAHRWFEAVAAARPGAVAVVVDGMDLTYGELERRANGLAHRLAALGVRRSMPVGLFTERGLDMVVALLAIWKAGGAFLPLDPAMPRPRLALILEDVFQDVEAGLVLAQAALAARLPESRARVVRLEPEESAAPPRVDVGLDDLAYVIYTSGTSGVPKGVLVEHGNLAHLLAASRREFGWDASDRMPCLAAFTFDIFLFELLNPLLAGGTAVLFSLRPVPDVARLVEELPAMTRIHAVPALMREVVQEVREQGLDGEAFRGLRTAFVGGDLVPDELLEDLLRVFPSTEVRVLYGPTEGTIICSSHPVPRGPEVRALLGRPLSNVTLRLRDRAGNLAPIGAPGEITIGGAAVGRGYLHREELTRERFVILEGERCYRTGDLARFLPDGSLEFLGRADQQVKIRGFRIELGEVEAALLRHPAVGEVAVVAREDTPGDRRLVAYVVCHPEDDLDWAAAELESEQVEQWRTVYDTNLFGHAAAELSDPTFNVSGWNSSYTGEPIPESEMREWVEGTVGRILDRLPPEPRVLEVGCGTGLLLFRLAPHCRRYVGTDFSETELAYVRGVLASQADPPSGVELRRALADDFSGVEPGSFDAVVLNSVSQYFPSVDYLARVIAAAVRAVAPGGFVFVGDVRNLALLRALHVSVELERAPASLSRERLAGRVEVRMAEEEELLLEPGLFSALRAHLPDVSGVEVQLRRGAGHNELTRFRYDAVLYVGGAPERGAAEWDWRRESLSLAAVRDRLRLEDAPPDVVLRRVPNARVAAALDALAQLENPEGPRTASELRQAVAAAVQEEPGLDPESFWALEEEVPYAVAATWPEAGGPGCFDVLFRRRGADGAAPLRTLPPGRAGHGPWSRYANNPLRKRIAQGIVPRLRASLAERLPDYMVPSAIVLLERLPRNSHGKVDRKALPIPENLRPELDQAFVAPRNPMEQALTGIWSRLLEVDRVGVHDNFFELGGHSLMATRAVAAVRQALGVELPLRALFEAPTVAGLAVKLEAAREEGELAAPPLEPRSRDGEIPLSFAQQRLWFLQQLDPGSSAYHMPGAFHFLGRLDEAALAAGFREIARRHEALRTRFQSVEGRPVQVVLPELAPRVLVVDLSGLPPDRRQTEREALATGVVRRPFDLARGPLLRLALLRLGGEERVLLATLHHIVADGWSMGVLIRELTTLYEALAAGRPSPLPELPVQYADFALWQQDWLRGPVRERELAWWTGRLTGVQALELPADRPRPAAQSFRGAGLALDLSGGTVAALTALAQRWGATLFMVLLAAFKALLHRYTGQEDVALGSPIANRERAEVEGLIGFFVNTLVLRTDLSGDPGFSGLVERVREVALGAYAHQNLPFEILVEELSPERDLSRQPLFQMMFQLIYPPALPSSAGGVRVEPLEVEPGTAHFDLGLDVVESPQGTTALARYSTDLFDGATIRRLLEHYAVLLAGIAAEPERRLSELPLLSEAEAHQLRREWNDTAVEAGGDVPVHRRFEALAAARPEALAVVAEGVELTCGELERKANRLAHRLISLGVKPSVPVGLCVERTPEMVVAILAIWKSGGAFLPLDPAAPRPRLAMILDDAFGEVEDAVVLTQGPLAAQLPESRARVVVLEDEDGGNAQPPEVETGPGDLAYLIYTSGTSGVPKAVLVEHGSLSNVLAVSRREFGWDASDRMPCLAAFTFDIFLFELLNPLLAGGTAVLASLRPVPDVARLVESLPGMTRLHAVPALAREIVQEARERGGVFPGLRTVFTGGDAVPADLLADLLEVFPAAETRILYGPTEGTIICSSCLVPRGEAARPLLGRPLGNTTLRLRDRAGNLVPIGAPGEIVLGGAAVSRGYLHREDLTRERFVTFDGERCYRTGDLARFLPDGRLEFLGRTDEQVKIRGFRVEPGEIEAALRSHPAVREAAVVARRDGSGERRLVAYAVLDEDTAAAGLRSFLEERLPDYMVPSVFMPLERLPLTPHGKVDRKALPAPEKARPELEGSFVAPRDPVEESLAEIWSRLLEVDRVGVHDNFFDLGGHSLMATRVVAAIRRALGVEVPLRALFEGPTVAELASVVAQAAEAGEAMAVPEPIPRQPRGPGVNRFPVSFSQLREWLLVQFEPGTTAYNMAGAVRITGRLDPALLGRALDAVVERHESLRTTFEGTSGEPLQVVAPSLRIPLPTVDLSRLSEERAEEAARRLIQGDAATPFDLARGPLIRVALMRFSPGDHVLLLNMHHIVSDGWSIQGVFFPELAELYAAMADGRVPVLRELPVQVPDFAVWQRGRLQGETLQGHLEYWKARLEGAPPLLDIPTDRPRLAVRSGRGRRLDFRLGLELTMALRTLARREKASLFMALLAVFKTVLHRYSGQDDLSVGTYISNRRQSELEGLIGFFVNTLVLRTDLAGGPGFAELLRRVREVTLGAYAHQDLPFEKVLDALQLERDVSRTPLIQALLTLHNFPSARLETPELTFDSIPIDLGFADFDLTLMLNETPDGIGGYIDYSFDLYEPSTIRALLAGFTRVAEAATADPGRPVDALPLMTETERRQLLLSCFTAPAEPPLGSVEELVAVQAGVRPGAPAVEHEGVTLTYAELEDRAERLARRLRVLGIGPETVAGIALERCPAAIVAMLGVLKAGGAYVPLDPAYPPERQAFMLEDSGARVLIAGGNGEANLPRVTLTPDGTLAEAGDEDLASFPAAPPESPAYIIYTSGSTGRPKGVLVPRRSLAHYAEVAARGYAIQPGDRVLQFASFSFDTSAEEIYPCLVRGATLVLRTEAMAASIPGFLAEVERLEITVLDLPTAYWHEMVAALDAGGLALPPSLRLVILGGEKALADRMAAWVRHAGAGPRLVNTYGPTEATIVATRWDLPTGFAGAGDRPPEVPIGRAIPGAAAWVLDRRLEPVPPGAPGELWIGGAGLARGYLGRPDLTAERFMPHPFAQKAGERLYRTGDLVRRRTDGELQFLGRADQQIKLRGFRIEPGEIEAALRRHPAVRDALAGLHQDRLGNRRLAAWVIPEGEAVQPAELRSFLKERLPDHMVPALFVTTGSWPLTPSGKIDRRRLPAPEEERPDLEAAYVAPSSDLERTLAGLWREVLPVDRVGIHDNFFELGGDSLLLLQVHRRLAEALGEAAGELSVIDLFQYPTIAALAQRLAARVGPVREAAKPAFDRVQEKTAQQKAALARQKQRMAANPPGRGPRRPPRS